jgi:hypothetical protein
MASEEEDDEDSDDNGAESRYDTTSFLMHLPDVRSLQASRAASVPVEGEEEPAGGRA